MLPSDSAVAGHRLAEALVQGVSRHRGCASGDGNVAPAFVEIANQLSTTALA